MGKKGSGNKKEKYSKQSIRTDKNKERRKEKWKKNRLRWKNDKDYQKRQQEREQRLGRTKKIEEIMKIENQK